MTPPTKVLKRSLAAFGTVLVGSTLICPPLLAQDAFNGAYGSLDNDIRKHARYPEAWYRFGEDVFQSDQAPMLEGATNGTIDPQKLTPEEQAEQNNLSTIKAEAVSIRDDVYSAATRLPDAKILLGESLCDLSYRPIACDEVRERSFLPPLPRQITVSHQITEAQLDKEPVSRGFNFGIHFALPGREPVITDQWGRQQLPPELAVPAEAVQAMSEANRMASENEDFQSRFAVYCMQLDHTGRVPSYLNDAVMNLRQAELSPPAAFMAMAKLRMAIASVPASKANATERAVLAARLEREGKYYEALVERLRCVDLTHGGPSRLSLAKLYFRMKEPKLAFETLRDAAEQRWPDNKTDQLAEVHFLLGSHLYMLAKQALKNGCPDLYLVRLQNASACLRRAVYLNPANKEAVNTLILVAKEGTANDNSFDNQLMLGGAYLISGDLEGAKNSYDECTAKNRGERRLLQARHLLAQASKNGRPDQGAELSLHAEKKEIASPPPNPGESNSGI